MTAPQRLFGGVEAGGTKFVCVVGTGPEDIRGEARFPTAGPAETLGEVLRFFGDQQARHGPQPALGVEVTKP